VFEIPCSWVEEIKDFDWGIECLKGAIFRAGKQQRFSLFPARNLFFSLQKNGAVGGLNKEVKETTTQSNQLQFMRPSLIDNDWWIKHQYYISNTPKLLEKVT